MSPGVLVLFFLSCPLFVGARHAEEKRICEFLVGFQKSCLNLSLPQYTLQGRSTHHIWKHTIIKLVLWFGPARHRLPWLSRID